MLAWRTCLPGGRMLAWRAHAALLNACLPGGRILAWKAHAWRAHACLEGACCATNCMMAGWLRALPVNCMVAWWLHAVQVGACMP